VKRSLFFALFALATVALLVTGCKTVGVASARAGEVESFESGLGTINVPRLALGQVFGINRIAKRGMPIDKVKYSTKDVSSDQKIDALKIGFDSKLDISFGANIPAAVQGSFSTAIAKSTEL